MALGTALGDSPITSASEPEPALPTYQTAAKVLEDDKGSGLKLVGYTLLRTLMIAPPMMMIGVPAKKAWLGALFASSMMSIFVLLRVFDARATNLEGLRRPSCGRARPRYRQ